MNAARSLACLAPVFVAGLAVAGAGSLDWRHDPAPDTLLPSRDGRPLLLYFTAAWCGPCKLLEREVFSHPEGLAELARFDLVRLDLDGPHGRALADSHRVVSVPTIVLLDAGGAMLERIGGYRSRRLLLGDLARFREGRGTRADLERRLAEAPEDPVLQAELGLRLVEHHEPAAAAAFLATSLAAGRALPDSLAAGAARALAELHRRRGESERAAAVLEHLLAGWPEHPYPRATWQLLATVRGEAGHPSQALAALHAAASLPPLRRDALQAFAAAAAAEGVMLEEAEQAARRAVSMSDRADPEALATLAEVLRRRRQYPEAMLWIRRAVEAAPDDGRWHERRAAIRQAALRGD